jgi:hypothetical protein
MMTLGIDGEGNGFLDKCVVALGGLVRVVVYVVGIVALGVALWLFYPGDIMNTPFASLTLKTVSDYVLWGAAAVVLVPKLVVKLFYPGEEVDYLGWAKSSWVAVLVAIGLWLVWVNYHPPY